MLSFVQGDLLQATEPYIAQGVAEGNQEGMGTGLALKISRRWPEIQAGFKKFARSGNFKGGGLWSHPGIDGGPGVFYLATQPDMYHATMPYLRKSLRRLKKWSAEGGVSAVALPKIGAGLGKLSWEDQVKPLFVEILSESETHFVVYETFINEFEASSSE
ncbi:Appr-1-p processing protein [Posidoniimonas polymericola]|uniref:Appr-1-p processing protein n=1 Tax=Posidoniimonas polymericola TaxID=2528002 RepID=UPI0011B3E469|nr:Appr-1-p processing protein [Posidoniimonas polymericola]